LLTSRSLLAHGVHLEAEEWALLAARGSVVVHCPGANLFLRSGLFNLDAAHAHGVRLAVGSDVAAGPDLAMPRVARSMIEMAKLRQMTVDPDASIPTPADAWRMITLGNARALEFDDAGRLEPGAAADLLVVRPPFEVDDHLIGRLIYTWQNEYIAYRIVDGRIVEAGQLA
jgi:guanine deaminase